MSNENDKLQGDLVKATEIIEHLQQGYGEYLKALGGVYDRAASLNKEVCSFNERMMLVALGILGISITSIISQSSKFSASPLARNVLVYYVVPAWILLALSVLTCRNAMVLALRANRVIYVELNTKMNNHHTQQMVLSLKKLSNAVSGNITHDSKIQPLSAVVSELETQSLTMLKEEANRPGLEAVTQQDTKNLRIQSGIAIWTLQISFALLCIAAIRLILL